MTVGKQDAVHLFLCQRGRMLPRWSEAFAAGQAGKIHSARSGSKAGQIDLVWLRLEPDSLVAAQLGALAPSLQLLPCVILSDRPSDEEALAAFTAGARGYCNTHTAAPVLAQVAAVVLQGGLWIGESLMQRLVSATSRLQAASAAVVVVEPDDGAWAENLTEREKEVARTLAKGASNKEIARILGITERTVKAHVGAVLEKLQVRDRLQLSLIVNGRRATTSV